MRGVRDIKRVVIIGGGAAGLMAAVALGENADVHITILEKNTRPARKMMITGKGRCNVTNNCDVDTLHKNTLRGSKFMFSAFNTFSSRDTISFFENLGVPLKTERGNRVFPVSDKAVTITDAITLAAKKRAKIITATAKKIITKDDRVSSVLCEDGTSYPADAVILATGGNYYSLTGSTGDGYRIAEDLGHTVTEIMPSLIGLTCKEGFCERLAGLTLKNVSLSLYAEGIKKPIMKETGEMLFTHNGISGPLVLTASALLKPGRQHKVIIDLKPGMTSETLKNRILRDFGENSNREFKNSLSKLLPASLIPVVVSLSGIDPEKKVNQITAAEREALILVLKEFTLNIIGTEDPDRAVITRGGINLKEINPSTMQSKLVNGLFFAGEVLDVDALTGGFNLQIAFSSGYLAGISAAKLLEGE